MEIAYAIVVGIVNFMLGYIARCLWENRRLRKDPKGGYENIGEFALDLYKESTTGKQSEKLKQYSKRILLYYRNRELAVWKIQEPNGEYRYENAGWQKKPPKGI